MAMRMPFEIEAVEEAFDPHRVPLAWRNLVADPFVLAPKSSGHAQRSFLRVPL